MELPSFKEDHISQMPALQMLMKLDEQGLTKARMLAEPILQACFRPCRTKAKWLLTVFTSKV